ncbi:MAG: HAMP domain-containing histidine kinase [Campylobacterales bacterium]|nr:HAMP domain-containing histidine kinase [Campylobacterales bacterium]MBN2832140.1 HAMP domain-containing histidine kinase [Campylobacterales bacterium]
MKNETKSVFAFAMILTFLTLLLVSFPLLNYLSVSLRLNQLTQENQLKAYAKELEVTIQNIMPVQKTFLFPRSILYKVALLDANNHIIFSLINEAIPPINDAFVRSGKSLFYRHTLPPNVLHVKHLIIQKEISHSKVFFDSLIVIGVVIIGMFLLTFLLLKLLLKPYIETSSRMNHFFTDVMHELKTPLGIMQLNLEGLVKKYKDKRLNRSLAALSTLSTLYDDLEYLIKYKTITYTKENLPISDFLEERIAYFEALSSSKEMCIQASIEPEHMLYINRIEFQRIVDNTITNAIKYSPAKTSLFIALLQNDTGLYLCIKDEGMGIKEIDKIFERHYRGDIYKGGFGIGLSIVKSICDKYKIEIEVKSEEKKGTEFIYKLK